MKTTLILPDDVVHRLKQRAMAQGRSMSSVAEEALVALLDNPEARSTPDLPTFAAGRPRVDVADRDALERAMRS